MSEMLEKARKYEFTQGQQIKAEDRPAFHITPYVGWMNDPNGFSCYKGEYHLFYQYNPYNTHWDSMHWGHVVSKDLLHWDYLPAALAPDQDYDKVGCFSGSAIELEDGRQLLMYTAVDREILEDGTARDVQTQAVAGMMIGSVSPSNPSWESEASKSSSPEKSSSASPEVNPVNSETLAKESSLCVSSDSWEPPSKESVSSVKNPSSSAA